MSSCAAVSAAKTREKNAQEWPRSSGGFQTTGRAPLLETASDGAGRGEQAHLLESGTCLSHRAARWWAWRRAGALDAATVAA